MVRHALAERLHTGFTYMDFYAECDVCHRDDTEGCIDVRNFDKDYYRECCTPGPNGVPMGGTLFLTAAGRVVCADCVRALGWRGKAAAYGVTLSMLVLAGGRAREISAFWRAGVPPASQSKGVCGYSGDALRRNWHICDPCLVLLCAGALPYRRHPCGCQALPPLSAIAVKPESARANPKALATLARMTLSTMDLGVVRQLEMALA